MSSPSSVFKGPWAILLGALAGLFVGLWSERTAELIAPVGVVYISLLQMCVLPILISAIVGCVYKLLQDRHISAYLTRIAVVFALGFLLTASIGAVLSVVVSPGTQMDEQSRKNLGALLLQSPEGREAARKYEQVYLDQPVVVESEQGVLEFLLSIVPENIFRSMVQGESLQVLLFAVILGSALGVLKGEKSEAAILFFDAIYDAFLWVVGMLMHLLPFGLCALVAHQVSSVGTEFLLAVASLVVLVVSISAVLIAVGMVVVTLHHRKTTLWQTIQALKEPVLIGLVTTNSLAAIPSAITALTREIRLVPTQVNLMIPAGITVARFGTILVFAIMACYMAQVYEVELGFSELLLIVLGAILGGLSTAGAPGEVAASMVLVVLAPLGLPAETAITILLLINPVVDPFLTALNVQGNLTATVLLAQEANEEGEGV